MDLRLFFRVLRRFRFIAALGFLMAIALAFLSFVRVDQHGLRYRSSVTWTSTARALIAAEGQSTVATGGPEASTAAPLYASLLSSDKVHAMAYRIHGIRGGLSAQAAYDQKSQAGLPILYVSGFAATQAGAANLANDGVTALNKFITAQQIASKVPPSQRLHLQYLNTASPFTATVATPRSKTRPILVLVLGIAATLGLVLILENLRPRVREVRPEAERAA